MAHNEEYAKRLLRELPDDPALLIKRTKTYADATFLGLFIPYVEGLIFDDPRAALKWARIMPDLALVVEEREGPDGRQEHRSRVTKAWIISGSAHRACTEHHQAEYAFAQAVNLAESETIAPLVHSELDFRRAYLYACQNRFDEALELATSSVARVPEGETDAFVLSTISRGYALLGLARFAEAIEEFGTALKLIDPKESDKAERMHLSAVSNMAYAVSASPSHRDQVRALAYVRTAQKLVKGGRRLVPRYRLLWIEGLICSRLGSHARAEKAFQIALEGFESLDLPFETALVALDLGQLYALLGDWERLEPLAQGTFDRFQILAADTGAIAALSQWVDAVKARDVKDEIVARARRLVEKKIGPGGCSKTRKKGPTE